MFTSRKTGIGFDSKRISPDHLGTLLTGPIIIEKRICPINVFLLHEKRLESLDSFDPEFVVGQPQVFQNALGAGIEIYHWFPRDLGLTEDMSYDDQRY